MPTPLHAIVVGASLAGLATSLAIARSGPRVTVLERVDPAPRSGGAVGVDAAHLHRVTGVNAADSHRGSRPESWSGLHARLLAAADLHENITVLHNQHVRAAGQNTHGAWAATDTAVHRGDLLIGADGYRSVVRSAVAPEHPTASYAGYVLWLGIVEERQLDHGGRWPGDADILDADDAVLIGYPLEGADGSRQPGRRRLGWAWFDPTRNDLLREIGAIQGTTVQHSVRSTDVPRATLEELHHEARLWPEPWRSAVRTSADAAEVIGTPIAEYVPRRLAAGRIALVGNAAHVPTPMTGRGFDTSLDDADSLADVLNGIDHAGVPEALQTFEFHRLEPVRAMVRSGMSFSERFGRP